jgi:hypothetical protein
MKRTLITGLLTIPVIFLLCGMTPASGDGDTYWYVNGNKYYWHYQQDVFAFRKTNGTPWFGMLDTNAVKFIFHRGMHNDKMNILYFKKGCSEEAKASIKETIKAAPDFETEFPAITLYPEKTYDAKAWFVIDDLLLVNFDQERLNQTTFNAFKAQYDLEQINFPNSVFPDGIATYVFETNIHGQGTGNAIDLARDIFTESTGLVQNVQPNLIYAYEETSNESINLLNSGSTRLNATGIEYYLVNTQSQAVKLFVNFKIANPQAVVKVYDLFGREMTSYEARHEKEQIEILTAEYSGGIYFVSIENRKGEPVIVEKFLKL